ncbi:hypothetical protein [Polynucleobacter sp. JS-Polo-80-F4]|uniref:hypothetical protein n=1 Tax=Polynucleobacter sp. JS-Polo-80-F4 TaxID=2576918 RepID=UPI001C0B39EA|nr:hypothetical protein [Polynucleobacter sp. JS-Polo-80-F4]MBU3617380.1 hypothetical protein [Polynucleobacter sp. JS-Polo-80-F4]
MQLIDFWMRFDPNAYPYVHPSDSSVIGDITKSKHFKLSPINYDSYLVSDNFGSHSDSRMDLSLLPIPYAGDISNSKIVILLLNPGLSYTDYYGEFLRSEYRERLINNLQQDFSQTEFPFMWLDPNLAWHGGFQWWEKKLRGVISEVARVKFAGSYYEALKHTSKNISQIELIPYHSINFKSSGIVNRLASAQEALNFVKNVLEPQTISGEKSIIVTRKAREWGVAESGNICVYDRNQARGASLGLDLKGGQLILSRLLEN